MSLVLEKLLSSAESVQQEKEDSKDPPDVKKIGDEVIWQEILRLGKLYDDVAKVETLRRKTMIHDAARG